MSAAQTLDLTDVITGAIASNLSDVHTVIPGIVKAFNGGTKPTVDVQPAIKKSLFDPETNERTFEESPIIPNVPVQYPRASGFSITFPLAVGDSVLLFFSEVSLSEYMATGQLSEPSDSRRLSNGYPVATPGGFPDTKPLADPVQSAAMVMGADGGQGQIKLESAMLTLGKGATDFAALASVTDSNFTAVKARLDLLAVSIAGINTWLAAHTHTALGPAVPTAPPDQVAGIAALNPVPPTMTPGPSAVGCTMVKIK